MKKAMKLHENEDLSGPSVQKRDIMVVGGVLLSWVIVVVLIIGYRRSNNYLLSEPIVSNDQINIATVSKSSSKPRKLIIENVISDGAVLQNRGVYEILPDQQAQLQGVINSIKNRAMLRQDRDFKLATAEPPAPVAENEKLILENPVVESSSIESDQSVEQVEGDADVLSAPPSDGTEADSVPEKNH